MTLTMNDLRKLSGKRVYAVKKDGSRITGKLVRIGNGKYAIRPDRKAVHTKAIVPLVLFDLLAIGTQPYGFYGPYGPYYGGYGGYPYPGYFY